MKEVNFKLTNGRMTNFLLSRHTACRRPRFTGAVCLLTAQNLQVKFRFDPEEY